MTSKTTAVTEEIRPNDFVKHIPSGEEWVVCGVNYEQGKLIPCGYPFPSMANISDCELTEARNKPQDSDMVRALTQHGCQSYIEPATAKEATHA